MKFRSSLLFFTAWALTACQSPTPGELDTTNSYSNKEFRLTKTEELTPEPRAEAYHDEKNVLLASETGLAIHDKTTGDLLKRFEFRGGVPRIWGTSGENWIVANPSWYAFINKETHEMKPPVSFPGKFVGELGENAFAQTSAGVLYRSEFDSFGITKSEALRFDPSKVPDAQIVDAVAKRREFLMTRLKNEAFELVEATLPENALSMELKNTFTFPADTSVQLRSRARGELAELLTQQKATLPAYTYRVMNTGKWFSCNSDGKIVPTEFSKIGSSLGTKIPENLSPFRVGERTFLLAGDYFYDASDLKKMKTEGVEGSISSLHQEDYDLSKYWVRHEGKSDLYTIELADEVLTFKKANNTSIVWEKPNQILPLGTGWLHLSNRSNLSATTAAHLSLDPAENKPLLPKVKDVCLASPGSIAALVEDGNRLKIGTIGEDRTFKSTGDYLFVDTYDSIAQRTNSSDEFLFRKDGEYFVVDSVNVKTGEIASVARFTVPEIAKNYMRTYSVVNGIVFEKEKTAVWVDYKGKILSSFSDTDMKQYNPRSKLFVGKSAAEGIFVMGKTHANFKSPTGELVSVFSLNDGTVAFLNKINGNYFYQEAEGAHAGQSVQLNIPIPKEFEIVDAVAASDKNQMLLVLKSGFGKIYTYTLESKPKA